MRTAPPAANMTVSCSKANRVHTRGGRNTLTVAFFVASIKFEHDARPA